MIALEPSNDFNLACCSILSLSDGLFLSKYWSLLIAFAPANRTLAGAKLLGGGAVNELVEPEEYDDPVNIV